jgi:hypothetical protein
MINRFGAPPRAEGAEAEPNPASVNSEADAGLNVSETRSAARRQLIGSVVVACGVAIIVGLAALRPNHQATSHQNAYRFPVIQQPIFVRSEHHIAATSSTRPTIPAVRVPAASRIDSTGAD